MFRIGLLRPGGGGPGAAGAGSPPGQARTRRAFILLYAPVRWTETCYCPTPLKHERATVLDRYFSDIETEPVDAHAGFEGEPLMARLAAAAQRTRA